MSLGNQEPCRNPESIRVETGEIRSAMNLGNQEPCRNRGGWSADLATNQGLRAHCLLDCNEILQFFHGEPSPGAVDHPVAVRAQQRQVASLVWVSPVTCSGVRW